ncbi:MAG: adenylate kinase [Parcubacteria group bacterium]|nr:adenylate kinase [Parcubacteria group bacterium]
MRISIIGLPASGKSLLARELSRRLHIPHIHLDRFWFEANGQHVKRSEVEKREVVRAYVKQKTHEVISQDAWVSDGFYGKAQSDIAARAELLIFVDIPLFERVYNHISRVLRQDHRHAEVSFWEDLAFTSEVILRTFRTGPKIRAFLNTYKGPLVTIKSRADMRAYLSQYPEEK